MLEHQFNLLTQSVNNSKANSNSKLITVADLPVSITSKQPITLILGKIGNSKTIHTYFKDNKIVTVVYDTMFLTSDDGFDVDFIDSPEVVPVVDNSNFVGQFDINPSFSSFEFCQLLLSRNVSLYFDEFNFLFDEDYQDKIEDNIFIFGKTA